MSTTTVNHLHTCQTPNMAYCQERATDLVQLPDGATIETCQYHIDELIRDNGAEPLMPIGPRDLPAWQQA
jgi:hypothetical protein